MKTILVMLTMAAMAGPVAGTTLTGDFCPGTGAEFRSSTNYVIADTLGQFVVDQSASTNFIVEHGFWHSDIHTATIAELKQASNYSHVDAHAKIVTAGNSQFYRTFYIAEQDRVGAIRVNVGANPDIHVIPGDMVDVSGVIKGANLDRYIDYPVVTVRFSNVMQLGAFFIPNRWLGGEGTDVLVPGGAGALNTSLLMKTSGRVTYVDTSVPAKFFYVDDGSGLSDGLVYNGQIMRGLRVSIGNLATGNIITPPTENQYVTVTGICGMYTVSGKTLALLRPRNQADVQVIASK